VSVRSGDQNGVVRSFVYFFPENYTASGSQSVHLSNDHQQEDKGTR